MTSTPCLPRPGIGPATAGVRRIVATQYQNGGQYSNCIPVRCSFNEFKSLLDWLTLIVTA